MEPKIKKQFSKPALTFNEQLNTLLNRGLIVQNNEETLNLLTHINYYHLEGYWFTYYIKNTDLNKIHKFEDNTNFSDIWKVYCFDRELKLLLISALERIELSFRTQFIYYISHKLTIFPFSNKYFKFKDNNDEKYSMKKLRKTIKKATEPFIYSYQEKYIEEIPPLWITGELLTFGELSVWFNKLINIEVQELISSTYNITPSTLKSWLHHLSYVRNCCAHHSRVWNKAFTIIPKIPSDHVITDLFIPLENEQTPESKKLLKNGRRIYNSIIIIDYLWDIICFDCKRPWRFKIKDLIEKYNIDSERMGFSNNWETKAFWK